MLLVLIASQVLALGERVNEFGDVQRPEIELTDSEVRKYAFTCLFDPVLELIEILALSHFDLKVFVKSLEIAAYNKELLELIENVKNDLQNLLH